MEGCELVQRHDVTFVQFGHLVDRERMYASLVLHHRRMPASIPSMQLDPFNDSKINFIVSP